MKSCFNIRTGFFLSLLLLAIGANAQSKKVWINEANQFYAVEDYASALKYYRLAMDDSAAMAERVYPYEVSLTNQKLPKKDIGEDSTKTVTLEDYVNHRIGMCYHYTNDYPHALEAFQQTSANGSYPEDMYYYGVALMNNNRYEEAVEVLNNYVQSPEIPDSLIQPSQQAITGCRYAMNDESLKMEVYVDMADTMVFNKGTASFAPMYWGSDDKLLFTSARDGGVIFDPEEQDSRYLCDLYWTERGTDSVWQEARNFGRPLNSSQHDAAGCFNNKNVIFYTSWSNDNPSKQHIYLARMQEMKFFEAYKLDSNVNVDGYKSIHPYVTKDGKYLYFSSDRPGGFGGMDIWRVQIDENGNVVGEAENLGEPVNSAFNEVTPFYHRSNLFFSSDGQGSMGGLDVFKSFYNDEFEQFEAPKNMGMPINSPKDDAYLVWDDMLQFGFMASDREDCPSEHCYDIYHVTNAPITVTIEGFVVDVDTDEPIPFSTVSFKDVTYSKFEDFKITTDAEGFYFKELDLNMEIFLKATQQGYFADAANADTRFLTESTEILQDFFLQAIPKDEIEIAGIEYDFDSDKLRPKSEEILDELYEFLMINDNLVVEINSHTDSRGSDSYNLDLSKRRAQSCVNYLIAKGIPKERLSPKGYGETQPAPLKDEDNKKVLDDEGNPILLTNAYIDAEQSKAKKEEYHQRNRRTAFKVVGEGFNMESQ